MIYKDESRIQIAQGKFYIYDVQLRKYNRTTCIHDSCNGIQLTYISNAKDKDVGSAVPMSINHHYNRSKKIELDR